jgi:hypothetical protein
MNVRIARVKRFLGTLGAVMIVGGIGLGSVRAAADTPALAVELNKLESYDKGCRAYLVVNNASDTSYQAVKIDLVLFQPDGVIARRFAVDLAPLKAAKTTVKLFDIEGLACDKISSLLVNDVLDCKTDAGTVPECLAHMTLTSVAGPALTKFIKR